MFIQTRPMFIIPSYIVVFFYTSYTFLHSMLNKSYLQGVDRLLSTPYLHLIYTFLASIYTFWAFIYTF